MYTDFRNSFTGRFPEKFCRLRIDRFTLSVFLINDESQGSVSTCLRCDGTSACCLLQIYCSVCIERVFKIGQHLQELEQTVQWHLFSGLGVDQMLRFDLFCIKDTYSVSAQMLLFVTERA